MVFLPFSKLGKHYEKNEDINYLPWPALCYLICFPQLLFWYQISHFPLLPEFFKKKVSYEWNNEKQRKSWIKKVAAIGWKLKIMDSPSNTATTYFADPGAWTGSSPTLGTYVN